VTTDEVLIVVRQRIGEAVAVIGGETPRYVDSFLLKYIKTTNFKLKLFGIDTELTIDPDAETITPDPSDAHGLLLAMGAASQLIGDDLVHRLNTGEMGLSFTTGATQITTNQAAITLRLSSNTVRKDFDMLLNAYLSGDPNDVIERLQ
jgi:hypothetical protein